MVQILNWRTGAVIANLAGETLRNANLGGYNLTDADFRPHDLVAAELRGANLTGALFNDCRAWAARFEGTNQSGADFTGTEFQQAAPLRCVTGNGYKPGGTNGVMGRELSVVTNPNSDTQCVAYYMADDHIVLASHEIGSNIWTRIRGSTGPGASDNHNFISIGIDGEGFVHVFWHMHAIPMRWRIGTAPGIFQVATPSTPPISAGSTVETSVTYPYVLGLPDGDLLLLFRDGGSGNGDEIIYRWNLATHTWTNVLGANAALMFGGVDRCAYLNRPILTSDERLHISWCWREDATVKTNHDWFYIYADPPYVDWFNVEDEAMTLPIDLAESANCLARSIPQNTGLMNVQGMTIDDDDRPILAGFSDPGSGISQYFVTNWDGAAWQTRQVGTETLPFTLVNDQDLNSFKLMPPFLLSGGGITVLIFPSVGRGFPGWWAHVCQEPTLTTWDTVQLSATGGFATPAIDETLWKRDGRVHLFHQAPTTDDDTDGQIVSIFETTLAEIAALV